MMTIEQQALALINEVERERRIYTPTQVMDRECIVAAEAICRALERHEAFRQEVSEAMREADRILHSCGDYPANSRLRQCILSRFIIAPPVDPLAQTISDEFGTDVDPAIASRFRAALAKHGLQITGVET